MQFDLVRRFGVRVHEVEGLDEDIVFCPASDVAFIRAGLDARDRTQVAEWLLCAALGERSALDAR